MTKLPTVFKPALFLLAFSLLTAANLNCGKPLHQPPTTTGAEVIRQHRDEFIGSPRIEQISEHVWTALGFGLAATS
ncbi:MAG: hypothetical protein FJ022_08190, partial [Chloroflexi bacterium]|nr:hypothetical protein [Chloroflexota bacterium]MBM4450751.1 hypothetical protein [Chloroflexota bacterium]